MTIRSELIEPSKDVDEVARNVIGSAIEVHRHLGPGYLERIYEAALATELEIRGIQYQQQEPIGVQYKGRDVGQTRIDLLVEHCLIVEVKAVEMLLNIHHAQLISYLKATGLRLGLLANFNTPLMKSGIKRVVLSR